MQQVLLIRNRMERARRCRVRRVVWSVVVGILVAIARVDGSANVCAGKDVVAINRDDMVQRVFSLMDSYLRDFRHPDTHVLYGARLSTCDTWTSPEDVKAEKPKPWGYGSRIADTALHSGHLLVALLDAYEARPAPVLKENIAKTFAALKFIGSLPERYPKAGKKDLIGLVPRGPHPMDVTAYYDDSSMDQHTTYIISLARYASSSLASDADKQWIRQSLDKVGRRLERHNWSIKRADGVTEAHVGFSWTGFNSDHASILLPAVRALAVGTNVPHWNDVYEKFSRESNGNRWKRLQPGPHVRINGHPIYANQNAFRVHALYQMETNPQRKAILRGLLRQIAEMQMQRDFPGPFYTRFHTEAEWMRLRHELHWPSEQMHGCREAWNRFDSSVLDKGALAVLAHVRFPLGGFHMVLLSEYPEMIRGELPSIWKMLTTVDMRKIGAGETNYLMTVVALHTYAFYFRHPELFGGAGAKEPPVRGAAKEQVTLPLVGSARLGPTMDVAVSGRRAYAIGREKLHVLDVSDPVRPRAIGAIAGLGNVRQIVVRDGVAFITSREDGLFIVDVRRTEAGGPRLLSHYDTIEFATGVAIAGDVLFVACRNFGVELIDVSSPQNPKHLSTVRTGEAQSVVARDGFLYAGVWATSEVVVANVENPRQPKIVARVELDGYGDGVAIDGNYLYAATGHHARSEIHRQPGDPGFGRGHGLEIFDITIAEKPRWISRVKFPPLYNLHHDMWSVSVVDGHAFVADTHNGVFVVDVADVKNPLVVASCQLPGGSVEGTPGFVGGLALTDGFVLIAGGETDLHVASAPELARKIPLKTTRGPVIPPPNNEASDGRWNRYQCDGQVYAVDLIDNDRAVLACGAAGMQVVDLRMPVRQLAKWDPDGLVTDIAVSGGNVFAAAGRNGLWIGSLSERGDLIGKGQYRVEGRAVKQVEVPIAGTFALVQVGANDLHILDIRNPAEPKRVLRDSRLGLLYGDQIMRGVVEQRYACVFWHVSGLYWYDLPPERQPVFSGDRCPIRIGSINGLVAYRDSTLATLRGGYVLLRRGEQRSIDQLPVRRVGPPHDRLGKPTLFGSRLYAANRATGAVSIINIIDIDKPILVERIETRGNPGRVVVRGGKMLVPDGYEGLLLEKR